MQKLFALLEKLQDGRNRSGQELADNMQLTRGAVWHQVKQLQALGIDIHAVSGKGYRLPGGYEFLNAQEIKTALPHDVAEKISSIDVYQVVDSTNEKLLTESAREDVHGRLVLSEYQTAGRGRRGASWMAPPGSGLCMSLAWRFTNPNEAMGSLSLVIGLAVRRALLSLGAVGIKVKWPNDIYIDEGSGPAKIAGILIELRSELAGPSMVVIGLGLNLHLNPEVRRQIDQNVADLSSVCEDMPSRNETVSAICREVIRDLEQFSVSGFKHFIDEWREADFLYGRKIKLHIHNEALVGDVLGVDENGLLIMNVAGDMKTLFAGHVELLDT